MDELCTLFIKFVNIDKVIFLSLLIIWVVILISPNSVFGPNMVFDNNGTIDRSLTIPFILYANVSEKYTPPLVVGELTGIGEFTIETSDKEYLRPSRCKTYSRCCFSLMLMRDSSKSKLIDNKNKKKDNSIESFQ